MSEAPGSCSCEHTVNSTGHRQLQQNIPDEDSYHLSLHLQQRQYSTSLRAPHLVLPAASTDGNSTDGSSNGSSTRRRQLVQMSAGINGVQATYFLRTDDPVTVSHKLSAAANEGTLSSRLEQYGISTEVSGMHIEIFMLPTAQVIGMPAASNASQGWQQQCRQLVG